MTQYFDPKWLEAFANPENYWLFLVPFGFSVILNFAGRVPNKKQALLANDDTNQSSIVELILISSIVILVFATGLLAFDKVFSTNYYNYLFGFFS